LSDSTVIAALNRSFNIAHIDPDSDSLVVHHDSTVTCKEIKQIYGVGGYPSVIVFDRHGNWLGNGAGYRDPDAFLAWLDLVGEAR
jgi:thioredoxin-related protein